MSQIEVERWSIRLAKFNYNIAHINGEDNLWADLLSRWGASEEEEQIFPIISSLFVAPIAPSLDEDFKWPNVKDIKSSQNMWEKKTSDKIPTNVNQQGLLCNEHNSIWIPSEDTKLQLRICIISHCGRGGHRGIETTYKTIRDHFYWKDMKTDISVFCNTCLHCLTTIGGQRVPRPLGHAIHADKPNQLIHFDFLYMYPGDDNMKYVFIIKDDHSSFVLLEATEDCDAQTATKTLLKWFSMFGVVP